MHAERDANRHDKYTEQKVTQRPNILAVMGWGAVSLAVVMSSLCMPWGILRSSLLHPVSPTGLPLL